MNPVSKIQLFNMKLLILLTFISSAYGSENISVCSQVVDKFQKDLSSKDQVYSLAFSNGVTIFIRSANTVEGKSSSPKVVKMGYTHDTSANSKLSYGVLKVVKNTDHGKCAMKLSHLIEGSQTVGMKQVNMFFSIKDGKLSAKGSDASLNLVKKEMAHLFSDKLNLGAEER